VRPGRWFRGSPRWADLRRGRGRWFRAVPLVALAGSLLVIDAVPVGATHKLATPTNVQATAGNGQVTLTWDAVANANRYVVTFGTSPSGTTVNRAAFTNSYVASGLTNGQAYRLRVTAQSRSGTTDVHQASDPSAWVTVTPQVPLNAPTGLSVSEGNAALSLSWTASTSTGVTGYDVHYTSAAAGSVADGAAVTTGAASAGWVAVTRTGTTASQTISSLSNGTPYRVRVRAKSSTGLSGWVFGSGTPRAASVTLSGATTVVEGQKAALYVTVSPALPNLGTNQRNVTFTATRVTSEAGDHQPELVVTQGVGSTGGCPGSC